MPELAWLALLDEPRAGSVAVTDPVTGLDAGHLLVTLGRVKPLRDAVRIDPHVLGDGPAMAVSLVLPTRAARPLFDDPAVVHAMQAVLRDTARVEMFSTLVDGSTRWAGAVSGVRTETARQWRHWWDDDPFARLGPRVRIEVPAGVFRPGRLPAGPSHQRHAGAPWPWGVFEQD